MQHKEMHPRWCLRSCCVLEARKLVLFIVPLIFGHQCHELILHFIDGFEIMVCEDLVHGLADAVAFLAEAEYGV